MLSCKRGNEPHSVRTKILAAIPAKRIEPPASFVAWPGLRDAKGEIRDKTEDVDAVDTR